MVTATLENAVESAAKRIEDIRDKDQATYRNAVNRLAKDEKLTGKEMDELSTVMIRLGITPEQFRSDAATLKELATLQATDWRELLTGAKENAAAIQAKIKQKEQDIRQAQNEIMEFQRQSVDARAQNPIYLANLKRIDEIKLQHARIIDDTSV